jgi:hypothetical protein
VHALVDVETSRFANALGCRWRWQAGEAEKVWEEICGCGAGALRLCLGGNPLRSSGSAPSTSQILNAIIGHGLGKHSVDLTETLHVGKTGNLQTLRWCKLVHLCRSIIKARELQR